MRYGIKYRAEQQGVAGRLTGLTDAHSKKWEIHEAAMAFFIAYYNFCRVHMTLKSTPAKAAGLTSETWSLARLLDEASGV